MQFDKYRVSYMVKGRLHTTEFVDATQADAYAHKVGGRVDLVPGLIEPPDDTELRAEQAAQAMWEEDARNSEGVTQRIALEKARECALTVREMERSHALALAQYQKQCSDLEARGARRA